MKQFVDRLLRRPPQREWVAKMAIDSIDPPEYNDEPLPDGVERLTFSELSQEEHDKIFKDYGTRVGRLAELMELEAFADERLESLHTAGLTGWENGVWELKLEIMRRIRELRK